MTLPSQNRTTPRKPQYLEIGVFGSALRSIRFEDAPEGTTVMGVEIRRDGRWEPL